ncbi:MAG: sigma-70 family RNA polymerase sigma factor [Defluviitaleaceae bacterium]|nr:sigma-70 family RNA polymerase sigma factor [Defluviitaleaceae bacterium]MCL2262591.1 sigma-70 family RNA polymerase sigma factor [Defluviitaleaceae bacterium]
MDSKETILSIKRGDSDVFANIIEEYSGYLARVINNVYSLNVHDTEDIIAETMIAVWKSAKKLKEDLNFKSYLATIARNKTIDFVRKKRVNMVEMDITLLADSDLETDFLHKELLEFLRKKIKETKEPDRAILILKYQHGLKNKEIAAKLGLNQNIVDVKLSRQRAKFRKMIYSMEV